LDNSKLYVGITWHHLFSGLTLTRLKQYEEAIECFDKAVELDPSFAAPLNGKGAAYEKLKKFKDAMECYKKAVEVDKNCEVARWNQRKLILFHCKWV